MELAQRSKTANREPFIRIREVLTSTPWGGWVKDHMPEEMRRRFFLPFWPDDRVRRHLEMLKAFGFNSIQTGGNPCGAWWVGADEDEYRRQQLLRCRAARELGMSVSVAVWGAAVADAAKTGQQFSELDWSRPEDRARLEAWYRDQAEFAPLADRVVTHWVDPGKPQPGGIDTVVEMHNFILGIYREKNPQIHGVLSAWFMDNFLDVDDPACRRYPGFVSEGDLAAHKALDPDSDVALGRFNYNCDGTNVIGGNYGRTLAERESRVSGEVLEAIAATGRKAGIWGWYTADIEINPALHVRTDIMQHYFRNLPPQTRTAVAWHSIDDNFTGLNMQNLYVAGRLMQDPSLDAQALLAEFVVGFVGDRYAAPVTAALRAIEQARARSLLYNAKVQDAVAPGGAKWEERHWLPPSWLDDTASAVDAAIAGLRSVAPAPDARTAWPVVMEPAEYVGELKAHLEAIRQMLEFLKGVREFERLRSIGASSDTLLAAIDSLPVVEYDPAHSAGMEADIYRQKLADLRSADMGT